MFYGFSLTPSTCSTVVSYNLWIKGRGVLLSAVDLLREKCDSPLTTQELIIYVSACISGNVGPELSYTDVGMFVSSDGGNSWRQVIPIEV